MECKGCMADLSNLNNLNSITIRPNQGSWILDFEAVCSNCGTTTEGFSECFAHLTRDEGVDIWGNPLEEVPVEVEPVLVKRMEDFSSGEDFPFEGAVIHFCPTGRDKLGYRGV